VLVGLGTTFLAGTGNGVFSISSSYGPEGASVQTVDFNGDGKPDLAFVAPYDGAVTLLLNTAKGFRYVTSTSLSSSANPVKVGKPVTFTVLVRPAFPGLVTGSVTFHDGALALATVPVHERGASFSTARLSVGTHTIVAVYSGDGSFLPSTSTPLQQAVVDLTPPIITISAQPSILGPPDGRMVPVLVSGTIRDLGSGVLVNSVEYAVTDEYGKVQPAGHMALDSAGKYTFTVLLPASRLDNDNNGRRYMIRVSASDNAGNRGASWKVVTVPHDQR
jgi:hypothetical protein